MGADDWNEAKATITTEDGTTVEVPGDKIELESANLEVESNTREPVSMGFEYDEREIKFQATINVPTRSITCIECDYDNEIPAWAFIHVEFEDLEGLSGDYAIGFQCQNCGFPH